MTFKLSTGAATKRAANLRATASGRDTTNGLALSTIDPEVSPRSTQVTVLANQAAEGEILARENPDRRPEALLAVRNHVSSEQEERIQQAFAGSALLRDPDKLAYVRDFLHDIHEKYRSLNRGFVEAGNLLLQARDRLRDDYDLLEDSDLLLPFSKGMASKLRSIAMAVRTGVLAKEEIPGFTHAYMISRMPPPILEAARAAGLIRPDVRQKELECFIKAHRPKPGPALDGSDTSKLTRERETLNRRIGRLYEEIRSMKARVTEIDSMLEGTDTA